MSAKRRLPLALRLSEVSDRIRYTANNEHRWMLANSF